MKTVLLIEDNLEIRENTAEILELAGYRILAADNGQEGVQLATELRPDVILCDIMMPQLDGYEVLQILKRNPATACIPLVYLTAKTEKSEIQKAMELGAAGYICKPFEVTDLIYEIEKSLEKKTAALVSKQPVWPGKRTAGHDKSPYKS